MHNGCSSALVNFTQQRKTTDTVDTDTLNRCARSRSSKPSHNLKKTMINSSHFDNFRRRPSLPVFGTSMFSIIDFLCFLSQQIKAHQQMLRSWKTTVE